MSIFLLCNSLFWATIDLLSNKILSTWNFLYCKVWHPFIFCWFLTGYKSLFENMVITFRRGGSLSIWHITFFLPYFLHFQQVHWVYPVVLKQQLFFFFPQILDVCKPELREKYSEGSYGIPQMPRTKQLHSSGRHRYSWNLSKPEVTLGNPSGMFSVFTTRVEPTICTIHILISSLITRAGLGRTTSASIAL